MSPPDLSRGSERGVSSMTASGISWSTPPAAFWAESKTDGITPDGVRMTDRAILLGIDLGTSAVKTLAVTPQGQVLGRGSGTYEVDWVREGGAGQEPEGWWGATASA